MMSRIPQELLDQLRENLENYQESQLSELLNKLLERLAEVRGDTGRETHECDYFSETH